MEALSGNQYSGFQKALAGEQQRQMYSFDEDGHYAAFFGIPSLPKINYASELARQTFLDGDSSIIRHWLRFGIDGWRLDVAQMIGAGLGDAQNLELLRRLRLAARAENPEAYILGERSYDSELALQGADEAIGTSGGGEDGVMNFHGFGYPFTEWLSGHRIIGDSQINVPSHELAEILSEAYRVLPTSRANSGVQNLGLLS